LRFQTSFVKVGNVLALKQLCKTTGIEVSSGDHKAGDSSGIDLLLALFLELESDLVLKILLDGLCTHSGALLFNDGQLDSLRVAEKSYHKVRSDEDDAFSGVFEFFSKLGQVGDVESGAILLRLAKECLLLPVSQNRLDLELQNLFLLFFVLDFKLL